MTRRTADAAGGGFDGEDDEAYRGSLVKFEIKKGDPSATDYKREPALAVEFKVKGHEVTARDFLSLKLGVRPSDGAVSRFRQFLNALAEKPKTEEVWFDDETLEWGYDMDDDSAPPFAKLGNGPTELLFIGEKRDGKGYRITGYRSVKREKK